MAVQLGRSYRLAFAVRFKRPHRNSPGETTSHPSGLWLQVRTNRNPVVAPAVWWPRPPVRLPPAPDHRSLAGTWILPSRMGCAAPVSVRLTGQSDQCSLTGRLALAEPSIWALRNRKRSMVPAVQMKQSVALMAGSTPEFGQRIARSSTFDLEQYSPM